MHAWPVNVAACNQIAPTVSAVVAAQPARKAKREGKVANAAAPELCREAAT